MFQFDRVCRLFCEDPTTTQSDEFFGIFDVYVTSLQEAKQENDNVRRKKEEEEKIAKQHQEVIGAPFLHENSAETSKNLN